MVSPAEVFKLIERADERVKYASNRGDATAAFEQARASLDEAERAAGDLADPAARTALLAQIDRRRRDLDEREG